MPGGVRERAAVGTSSAQGGGVLRGHPAVKLVADQGSGADDIPLARLHAFVVVADRRQAVRGGAIAGDVHGGGAVAQ